MAVGRIGKLFDVQHSQGRVGNGLPKNGLGIGPKGRIELLGGAVRVHEGELDAHALHGDSKQVVGAAVDGGGGHHMVTAGGNIENGVEGGRLAGGEQHGSGASLQGADLGRHGVVGGVLEAGIEIAAGLQIKQLAHLLAGLIAEGGGLDDGEIPWLPVSGAVARMQAVGADLIVTHALIPSFSPERRRRSSVQCSLD